MRDRMRATVSCEVLEKLSEERDSLGIRERQRCKEEREKQGEKSQT